MILLWFGWLWTHFVCWSSCMASILFRCIWHNTLFVWLLSNAKHSWAFSSYLNFGGLQTHVSALNSYIACSSSCTLCCMTLHSALWDHPCNLLCASLMWERSDVHGEPFTLLLCFFSPEFSHSLYFIWHIMLFDVVFRSVWFSLRQKSTKSLESVQVWLEQKFPASIR